MARTSTTTVKRRKQITDEGTQTPGDEALPIPAKLRRLIANPEKDKLRWWFDVGHQVLRLHPEPEHDANRHYGTKTTKKIAKGLCPDDATEREKENMNNTLVQARMVARRFDENQWEKLKKFQGELSVSHMITLLSVDEAKGSKSTMEEIHARCVADRWSVDKLKREIQNDKGGKMASGRRPKPLPAVTSAIAVKDLIVAARQWTTYYDVCLAGRRPILKHARRKDYSAHLLRDVHNAIEGLKQVQEAVRDELQQLRQLAKNIKSAHKE